MKTLGFLIAIETDEKVNKDTIQQVLEQGLDGMGLQINRIDVGPLGELDVYPDDEPKSGKE